MPSAKRKKKCESKSAENCPSSSSQSLHHIGEDSEQDLSVKIRKRISVLPLQENNAKKRKIVNKNENLSSTSSEKDIDFHSMQLPTKAWSVHECNGQQIICKLNYRPAITHSIQIHKRSMKVDVMGRLIRGLASEYKDRNSLEHLVRRIDTLKLCGGPGLG